MRIVVLKALRTQFQTASAEPQLEEMNFQIFKIVPYHNSLHTNSTSQNGITLGP